MFGPLLVFFGNGLMMVVRGDVLNNGIKSSNLQECISLIFPDMKQVPIEKDILRVPCQWRLLD